MSTRQRLGPNAVRVAVVATFVLTALAVLIVVRSSSAGTYELRASFDDVRGLIPGGDVRAGAIPVGTVREVEIGDDGRPLVTMDVDIDFQVHYGATADIRLGSNVGAVNRSVELTQGDLSKRALADGAILRRAQTDQPVNFDEAVETLDPPTRGHIRRLLAGFDAALKNRGKDFDRTLQHSSRAVNETANLLAQVNSDGVALRTLVSQGDRVVSTLASSPQDLSEAADRTATLLAITARRQRELSESVRLLGPALARARGSLDALTYAVPNLRELISRARPLVEKLGPLARTLPAATAATGPFLAQTRKLVERGPANLRDFDPIVRATEAVAPRLNSTIRKVGPLGQELRVYGPEIIGFFQNFGAASGSFDKVGHMLSTSAGNGVFPPAAASAPEIGADSCEPGRLELPFIRLPGTNECQPWRNFRDSFIGPEGG